MQLATVFQCESSGSLDEIVPFRVSLQEKRGVWTFQSAYKCVLWDFYRPTEEMYEILAMSGHLEGFGAHDSRLGRHAERSEWCTSIQIAHASLLFAGGLPSEPIE